MFTKRMDSETIMLPKDILCYIFQKHFKINGVPLKHIHVLRNVYNSSKHIRRFMTKEQILTIEGWKQLLNYQMRICLRPNRKRLLHMSTTQHTKCTVCFSKFPWLIDTPHYKFGCPLQATFCNDHVGGTKLYPKCMFDKDKRECKMCTQKR